MALNNGKMTTCMVAHHNDKAAAVARGFGWQTMPLI
jgi:hypothetical protein